MELQRALLQGVSQSSPAGTPSALGWPWHTAGNSLSHSLDSTWSGSTSNLSLRVPLLKGVSLFNYFVLLWKLPEVPPVLFRRLAACRQVSATASRDVQRNSLC